MNFEYSNQFRYHTSFQAIFSTGTKFAQKWYFHEWQSNSEYVCPRLSHTKRDSYGIFSQCSISLLFFDVSSPKSHRDNKQEILMKGTSTNITKYKYCDYKYKKKLDRIAGFIKICKKEQLENIILRSLNILLQILTQR